VWTFIRGEMYVSCEGGCIPLPLEGLSPPPDSEELRPPPEGVSEVEHSLRVEGRETPEGGAASESEKRDRPQLEPTTEFLNVLWEGGWCHGTR